MKKEIIKNNISVSSFYIKKIFCFKNLILFISSFLILLTFYFNISTLATFADKEENKITLVHDKWIYMLLLLNIWFTLFFTYIYSFLKKFDALLKRKNLKNILISFIFISFQVIILFSLLITFKGEYGNDFYKEIIFLWIFQMLFIISSLLIISLFEFKKIKMYYLVIAFLVVIGFIFMISLLCTYPGMTSNSEIPFIDLEKTMIITLTSIILFFIGLKSCLIFLKSKNI